MMLHKVVRCLKCRNFFVTTARGRAKCPRCGRSQKAKPVYVTDNGLKAAEAVRQLSSPE